MAHGRDPDDDDDLDEEAPWLAEGVPDRGASATVVRRGRLVGGVLLFAALLALVVIGIYVIAAKKQDGGSGYARAEDAPLIAAESGPYKVRPNDPGGMDVAGTDSTIYSTGEGVDPGSSIDIGALPEEPLARPGTAPAPGSEQTAGQPVDLIPPLAKAATVTPTTPAPVRIEPVKVVPPAARPQVAATPPLASKPQVAVVQPPPTAIRIEPTKVTAPKPKDETAAAEPPAKPVAGPASLQLGAFSSSAKADAAWKAASGRYAYLAGLSKRVDKVERDGTTLYRLRVGGVVSKAAAADLCARLRIAGEACIVAE